MKNVILLSTLMLLVFAGCSKDQKAVKILDGKWKLMKVNGTALDADEVYTLEFSNCKLKKEEYCVLQIFYSLGGQSINLSAEYKVIDKGETLEMKVSSGGTTEIDRYKIKELTKTKLVMEVTEGTSVYSEEYTKL